MFEVLSLKVLEFTAEVFRLGSWWVLIDTFSVRLKEFWYNKNVIFTE